METFELRYFLMAAQLQSINKAATELAISAPAISKAIKRLEEELGVNLFERVGRNVVLSSNGKQLQKDINRIMGDLDDVKAKFKPKDYHLGISLVGTEFGFTAFVNEIIATLDVHKVKHIMNLKIGYSSREVERIVADGEAHLGLITRPPSSGFKKIKLGEYGSKVYLGRKHPLFKLAEKNHKIDIQSVLKHDFASFSGAVFSEVDQINHSVDGWRDDKFKRVVALKSDSIVAVLDLTEAGRYLSYLPTALAKTRDIVPLHIVGCPYQCSTGVYLIANKSSEYSWLTAFF